MDTSETYIKMCNCTEIILQAPRLSPKENPHEFWGSGGIGIPSPHPVWLPRQDQLQEMVDWASPAHLLERLNSWIMNTTEGLFPALFNSMEQLWLAFCMSEKYGKVWNGGNWIKE